MATTTMSTEPTEITTRTLLRNKRVHSGAAFLLRITCLFAGVADAVCSTISGNEDDGASEDIVHCMFVHGSGMTTTKVRHPPHSVA